MYHDRKKAEHDLQEAPVTECLFPSQVQRMIEHQGQQAAGGLT